MIEEILIQKCEATHQASKTLMCLSNDQKNQVLQNMISAITDAETLILTANLKDRENAKNNGLSPAMLDRLTLNADRINQIKGSLSEVINLSDPLAVEGNTWTRPNGIRVRRKRIPLGVILMIYESRPNVTVEAAALAFKSGNAIILRGGKEAINTNLQLAHCWQQALIEAGISPAAVNLLETTDRQALDVLLKQDQLIDVVIPRGGEGLIRHVTEHSRIPVIKHYQGICHLFVDESADQSMALSLLLNGKTQRPGVCNALEGVIIHQSIAEVFLPKMVEAFKQAGVEILGCEASRKIEPSLTLATEVDFETEFLSLKISCKVVKDIEEAITFIDRFGSHHTEVIATQNDQNAQYFINRVDASVVMVNASSRFSDGGELGLGAEIGISTSKIHAYGPMGLDSLTSEKFVVIGEGQVRG